MSGLGSKCIATIIVFLNLSKIKYVSGFYLLILYFCIYTNIRFCVMVVGDIIQSNNGRTRLTYVRTQYKVNGLYLYLGLQSIYIVGFEFPTMSSSMLGDPVAHTLILQILLFFLTELLLFLLI